MKKLRFFLIILAAVFWFATDAAAAIIVGRIAHVEGRIYRYMDVDQSWVETYPDSPAGTLDILATGPDSRADLKFPNNILIRLNHESEIEIVSLREESAVFSLQKGLARFYNHDAAVNLIIETALGTARISPGSSADIKINDNSVAIAAVQGQAAFQAADAGQEKQEIISGSTSLEFKQDSINVSTGPLDRNWNLWCKNRENILSRNRMVRSEYLPESMQEYAYILEPAGSWNRVYYRGYYYWAWRPSRVSVGWAPYTTGYWYDWHNEPVWIDYNSWGWVTHHHGNWLLLNNAWMWTPYVHVSPVPDVTVIGFNIHFGKKYRPHWHPGRVGWISTSHNIGWLPLAPWETYYGHHRWGPRSVIYPGKNRHGLKVNLARHRHIDRAVIIPRRDFKRRHPVARDHYAKVRIRHVNKTVIVKNYQPAGPGGASKAIRSAPVVIPKAAAPNKGAGRHPSRSVINQRAFEKKQRFREHAVNRPAPEKKIRSSKTVSRLPKFSTRKPEKIFSRSTQTKRQSSLGSRIRSEKSARILPEGRPGKRAQSEKDPGRKLRQRNGLRRSTDNGREKFSQKSAALEKMSNRSTQLRQNPKSSQRLNIKKNSRKVVQQGTIQNLKKQILRGQNADTDGRNSPELKKNSRKSSPRIEAVNRGRSYSSQSNSGGPRYGKKHRSEREGFTATLERRRPR